jgi:hypothetical protein
VNIGLTALKRPENEDVAGRTVPRASAYRRGVHPGVRRKMARVPGNRGDTCGGDGCETLTAALRHVSR